jgi:hypothetical protein
VREKLQERDRIILRLKAKEMSNRWIAGRLGLSEKAVRKSLRWLGWKPGPEASLSFLPEAGSQVQLASQITTSGVLKLLILCDAKKAKNAKKRLIRSRQVRGVGAARPLFSFNLKTIGTQKFGRRINTHQVRG